MKFYQELTVLVSFEEQFYSLWTQLYTQIHLALVEVKNSDDTVNIGVSFPEYQYFIADDGKTIAILGSKLRVFANSKAELECLNLNKWCARLLDYIHIKSIAEVGDKATGQVIVQRFRQIKNKDGQNQNFAKKKERNYADVRQNSIAHIAKTHGISSSEAEALYENPQLARRPYILMKSLKTKHRYSLEIEQISVEKPQTGTFNTYGLSANTTVPHW